MLTVTEVGHEAVEPDNGAAAEHSVVTGDLQLRQHVPHDPRHWAQVGNRDNAAVYRTRLLLGEPLRDAGIAEGMLTVRRLYRLLQDSTANRADKVLVNIPLETGYIIPHVSSLKPTS